MTGFIRGIFGSKDKGNNEPSQAPTSESAYFLDPDEAKTFGNIDYMRTPKTVKKTFPKGKVSGEYTKAVSATEEMDFSGTTTPQPVQKPRAAEPTPTAPPVQPKFTEEKAEARRKSDNSMDMFRNMARDIKKK